MIYFNRFFQEKNSFGVIIFVRIILNIGFKDKMTHYMEVFIL